MGRQRLHNQRCIGTCKDGSRCGRYCADGDTLCAKHNGSPATGIIKNQETDDPAVLLQRLMKDRDPAIRLRAIEAFTKYEERHQHTCSACATRAEADRQLDHFRQGLTRSERLTLVDLLASMKAFKESVYDRDPSLRPEDEPLPIASITPHAPAPTSAPVTLAAPDDDEPAPVAASLDEPDDEPLTPTGPVPLPRDRYAECGLIEVRGHWSHPRGDEHAHQIIDGHISFEDARAAHVAAQRQEQDLALEQIKRSTHRE